MSGIVSGYAYRSCRQHIIKKFYIFYNYIYSLNLLALIELSDHDSDVEQEYDPDWDLAWPRFIVLTPVNEN